MRRTIYSAFCGFLALSIALFPLTSGAIFPVAMFGKEILQNIIFGEVKNQMIGSLANMGCKGARLASVISSASAGMNSGGGLPGGMPGGGMGGMPGGGKGGMPGGGPGGGMAMPNGMKSPSKGVSLRAARTDGIPTMTPEQAQAMMAHGMPDPAQILQMMGQSVPPEQAAEMQQAMSGLQESMSHPLSRTETIEVFDEMASLGVMTNEMRSEARDCILLAPPGSENAIGSSGAMIKNTVLPALRDARQQMNNLTPEEQSLLTDGLVDSLQHTSVRDRDLFLEGFGAGFFPAPVVESVRARIGKH